MPNRKSIHLLTGFDTVNWHVCELEMHQYSWNIQMILCLIMHNID